MYYCYLQKLFLSDWISGYRFSLSNLFSNNKHLRLITMLMEWTTRMTIIFAYLYFSLVWDGKSRLLYCFEIALRSFSPRPCPPRAGSKVGLAAVVIFIKHFFTFKRLYSLTEVSKRWNYTHNSAQTEQLVIYGVNLLLMCSLNVAVNLR